MTEVANMDRVVFIDFSRYILFSKLPNARDLSNFQKVFPSELWVAHSKSPMVPKIRAVISCLNLELVAPNSIFAKPIDDEKRLERLNNVYASVCKSGNFIDYVGEFTIAEFDAMKETRRKILTSIATDAPIADSVIAMMLFNGGELRTTITRGEWTWSKEKYVTLNESANGRAITMCIEGDAAVGDIVMIRLRTCIEQLFV